MNTHDIMNTVKDRINEVDSKLDSLEFELESGDFKITPREKFYIDGLKELQQNIHSQLSILNKLEGHKQNENIDTNSSMSAIEKNIYTNLKSFDSAYKNAGQIFRR